MKWVFLDAMPWDYDVATPLFAPLGGSQSALCYLARALVRRGDTVYTVTATSQPRTFDGVACLNHRSLSRELLSQRQTVTVVLNGPAELGPRIRQMLGDPWRLVLWTQHAHDQPAMQALARRECQDAWDRVVCVSDWQRAMLHKRLGVPPERMEVLRNAVAPPFEKQLGSADALARAKAAPPRLAYTSTPFRGLDVLVRCFPRIQQLHPACELDVFSSMLVYGDLEEQDEFRGLYEQCRATPGIMYHGSLAQPQLARQLAAASVLAYPNTFAETSCIAAMEAMASGLMVVTSELGALPETCGEWARLVPPPDATRSVADFESDFIAAVDEVLWQLRRDPVSFWQRQYEQSRVISTLCSWQQRAAVWETAAERWWSNGTEGNGAMEQEVTE